MELKKTKENIDFICSNVFYLKKPPEKSNLKKYFVSKLVLAFHCSHSIVPVISNIFGTNFSPSREHIFLTLGQNNFQNKILPFFGAVYWIQVLLNSGRKYFRKLK